MFGFSSGEILLIALIALILFGNDKLPENMKKMIKGLNQAKKVAKDVQSSWQEVKIDVQRSILLEEETKQINDLIKDVTELEVDKGALQKQNRNEIYSVPQEELDTFQESYDNLSSETLYNLENQNKLSEANETEHFNNMNTALISPKEYMSSKQFVGPLL